MTPRALPLFLVIVFASAPASPAIVSSLSAQPVLIGYVTAGNSYTIVARGTVDLFAAWNNGRGLPFTADGRPAYVYPAPYTPFAPNGLDYDPSQNANAHGLGGGGKLFGGLMITFTANPTGYSDYVFAGQQFSFTAGSSGPVYGIVNDCSGCYGDNAGSYDVTLMATEKISYSYDAKGRLTSIVRGGGPRNGAQITISYDNADNRTRYVVSGIP